MAKADGASQHHGLQRPLGFLGERPSHEPGPAEGQLGRLDADQAHLGGAGDGTVQAHRITVDYLADNGATAVLQSICGTAAVLQPLGGKARRHRQKDGQEERGEGVAAAGHGSRSIAERRARLQNGAR